LARRAGSGTVVGWRALGYRSARRAFHRVSANNVTAPVKMQAFLQVQALVFDVFGTVVDWRSGIAREAAAFLARHAPAADPEVFADAWRQRYAPSMEEVRAGRRPFVRLDVLHRESLSAILPAFGVDPSSVPAPELDAPTLPGVASTHGPTLFRASSALGGASSLPHSPMATFG
jgi:hypothetical protein